MIRLLMERGADLSIQGTMSVPKKWWNVHRSDTR